MLATVNNILIATGGNPGHNLDDGKAEFRANHSDGRLYNIWMMK
jgi:hypothetical protein